ncbi:14724_t:CDS:2, partial [Racocetra fulgida]
STWLVEQADHSEYPNWNLLIMQLLDTAHYYMKEYKRPIVLILDQVDRIAKKDQEFLGMLQDFAKDLIPFEVGDISDEEAVKFLQNSGIDQKNAEVSVKYLTGGRFTLLKELQALNQLIEVGRIDIKQAKTIIPLNTIRKLVEANILKEDQDFTVSFHSRYVDTYFKEEILSN